MENRTTAPEVLEEAAVHTVIVARTGGLYLACFRVAKSVFLEPPARRYENRFRALREPPARRLRATPPERSGSAP